MNRCLLFLLIIFILISVPILADPCSGVDNATLRAALFHQRNLPLTYRYLSFKWRSLTPNRTAIKFVRAENQRIWGVDHLDGGGTNKRI